MKKIIAILLLLSVSAFAKNEKSIDIKRVPANFGILGKEAKSLFLSLYALWVSGGNAKLTDDSATNVMTIEVVKAVSGGALGGSVVCRQDNSLSKNDDRAYQCQIK